MRLGGYITWLNKVAIVEYELAIKLFPICHYCDTNEYSHVLFVDIIS